MDQFDVQDLLLLKESVRCYMDQTTREMMATREGSQSMDALQMRMANLQRQYKKLTEAELRIFGTVASFMREEGAASARLDGETHTV